MRIAVLRPQVPFARGGAEIFTDRLVDELRARGHEADLVSVPFKWYPGARVLTQAFLWRMLDLDEADGQHDRRRRRDEVPVVPRAPRRQAGVAGASVPAGVRARRDAARHSSATRRRIGRCDGRSRSSIASRSARRRGCSRPRTTSPTRLEISTGLSAEVLPHPPQELDYRCQGYGDFVLSVNRLDRAKRIDLLIEAAARDAGLEVVIAGDGPDRERLERLARERGLDGRARFAGRVSEAELADLYARCLAVYYAPGGRGLRDGAARGVPRGEARPHDDRRGRAARGRLRPRDRARRHARCDGDRDARSAGCASIATRRPSFGRAGNAIAREVTWDRAIGRLLA